VAGEIDFRIALHQDRNLRRDSLIRQIKLYPIRRPQ
jgi:hypothetical protein